MSRIKLEANVSTESFPKAPTFEATFSQTDGPDLTLAMTLRGMSDLFGAMLMQGVNDLPIHQEDVQKLSLQFVCLRNDFEFEVKQIIASTIYTVINKYFSPRVVLNYLMIWIRIGQQRSHAAGTIDSLNLLSRQFRRRSPNRICLRRQLLMSIVRPSVR